MVNEITTKLGTDLATEVEAKFGDAGNSQITRVMILAWINNGVREIVAKNNFLKGSAQANIVVGQNVLQFGTAFPAARIIAFHSMTLSGKPLKIVPFAEWETLVGLDVAANQASGTPRFATEFGGALTLWPVPDTNIVNGLTIYFSAFPAPMLLLTELMPVPDRFYNALNDYVLAQALELDENFEAAGVKMQQHTQGVQQQFEKDHASPTAFYPTMVADPDDRLVDGFGDSGGF